MKYYREIDIDDFEIIQEKSLVYANYVLNDRASKNINVIGYSDIPDFKKFLEQIPELSTSFAKYDLTIKSVAFYFTDHPTTDYVPADCPVKNFYHTRKNPVHTDVYHHFARVNIPILNTKGTFTRFFTNCVLKHWKNPFTGASFQIVGNRDYIEVDAVEILKPTVIRVQEPHLVQVYEGSPIPRITLTVGFDRDPVYLLEQE